MVQNQWAEVGDVKVIVDRISIQPIAGREGRAVVFDVRTKPSVDGPVTSSTDALLDQGLTERFKRYRLPPLGESDDSSSFREVFFVPPNKTSPVFFSTWTTSCFELWWRRRSSLVVKWWILLWVPPTGS